MIGSACFFLFVAATSVGSRISGQDEESVSLTVQTLFVSARTGDDERGVGSESEPYRSVHRALRELAEREAPQEAEIRVDVGRYDESSGEQFPLRVPANCRIRGHAPDVSVLDLGNAVCGIVVGNGGRAELADLGIHGGDAGCRITAPPSAVTTILLEDVLFERCAAGLVVEAESQDTALEVVLDSVRFIDCSDAVAVRGSGAISLEVARSRFRDGEVGVAVRVADAESRCRVDLRNSSFAGYRRAGVELNLAAAPNRPAPRIVECRFTECEIGVSLPLGGGDHPLFVSGCSFEDNRLFGIRAVGQNAGVVAEASRVEDSSFRWNGAAVQILNTASPYRLIGLEIFDQVGAGVSVASTRELDVELVDCVIAQNGAAGIHSLVDAQQLRLRIDQCTLADNRTAALHLTSKRGGQAGVSVRRSILAGETLVLGESDLDVAECLLFGSGVADAEGDTNLRGNPRFRDPTRRDYRLRDDSPAYRDKLGAGLAPSRESRPR